MLWSRCFVEEENKMEDLFIYFDLRISTEYVIARSGRDNLKHFERIERSNYSRLSPSAMAQKSILESLTQRNCPRDYTNDSWKSSTGIDARDRCAVSSYCDAYIYPWTKIEERLYGERRHHYYANNQSLILSDAYRNSTIIATPTSLCELLNERIHSLHNKWKEKTLQIFFRTFILYSVVRLI